MRASCLPRKRGASVPAYFAALSSTERRSKKPISSAVKSSSFRKERFFKLKAIVLFSPFIMPVFHCIGFVWFRFSVASEWIALQRTRHTVTTATPAIQFCSCNGDDVDARPTQFGIGIVIVFVGNHHPWLQGQNIIA